MIKFLKRLFVRLLMISSVGFLLVILTVISPTLLYGHETEVGEVTIRHEQPLPTGFVTLLEEAMVLVRNSELYDPTFSIQLCLSDGSRYPELIGKLKGEGFGHGFYNIALVSSKVNVKANLATLNGYNWNLKELIVHEILHTYQYNRYGFKTINFDQWKIEGYPEYISRRSKLPLAIEIERLIEHNGHKPIETWTWVNEEDESGVSLDYLKNHLLVRYMLEEEKMTYDQLLTDTRSKEHVVDQMMNWYNIQINRVE
ncbi:MAG: hypothetical protein HEP71_26420 [Roseivirga sp.]|nr:hypothetical protein [Roseivirga sp.]